MMGELRMLSGQCGSCGGKLQVKTHSAEKVVVCPKCKAQVTVSARDSEEHSRTRPSAPGSKLYAFTCPNCATEAEVKRSSVGKTVTCPACEQTIRVPGPNAQRRSSTNETEEPGLTLGDWAVCIILPCVGIIAGIVRFVQGKATGAAMIGYSVLFAFLWMLLKVGVEVLAAGTRK